MKYCDQHQIWYPYNDACPECTKLAGIVGSIIGGIIFAVIFTVVWIGKKIKERKELENYKSALRDIGLGDVSSVRNAWEQGNINFTECMAIVKALKS